MHIGNDSRGRAHGIVSNEDGLPRFQSSQAMVINNLNNMGFLDAGHCLGFLIVVNQNYFFPLRDNQSLAVDHADNSAIFRHRIVSEPGPHCGFPNITD